MPYIVKTAPLRAEPGDTVSVTERPFYGGREIRPGDEVFLWFSETQGGSGLAWRGRAGTVAPHRDGRRAEIAIRLETRALENAIGKAELEPLRNVRDGSAAAGLARKLYYHAHNKVASLTDEEAELLRGFFE